MGRGIQDDTKMILKQTIFSMFVAGGVTLPLYLLCSCRMVNWSPDVTPEIM